MSDDKANRIRQFAQDRICLLRKLAEIDKELEDNRLKLLTLQLRSPSSKQGR